MYRRKRIAFLTAQIEAVHERNSLDGILRQCQKYDYELCVFSTMVHLDFPREHYLKGETNIYRLVNFSEMDGIILDGTALDSDHTGEVVRMVCERLAAYPKLPVCVLQMPIEGYPLIESSNEPILRELCRHIIEVHHKTRLCVMTGQKGNYVAENRLAVMLDEIAKHGLTVKPEHILYGDFWYSSGDRLADQLLSGEISMPESVLCASDHMALGLIEKLEKNGIRVPDDLLVIGFDATDEGQTSRIPLSSYDASDVQLGADAVDWLRRHIEPDAPVQPYVMNTGDMFRPGISCGCKSDLMQTVNTLRHALYFTARNYVDPDLKQHVDMGLLMESYIFEN
ncbi:MAG: substrate-binding domain-containing protein, partial [Oscillospiraceae bacterium]|nr:substrate-binding domain-containing protein [Oscillospiraceae bacterium]